MFFIAGLAAVLLPGCMQLDYVGQRYTPTENIAFLGGGDAADGYDRMGRATLTVPEGYNAEEIRQKLIAEAKAAGADAVIVDSAKRQEIGSYETVDNDGGSFQPRGEWSSNTFNADGTQNSTNSWGQTGRDNTKEVKQYQTVVNAYFLRTKVKNAKDRADNAKTAKPATVKTVPAKAIEVPVTEVKPESAPAPTK